MRKALICVVLTLASGCAAIRHTTTIDQPLEKTMLVGVGDTVLRVNKQRNLKNAFGKADIFGRKTNEGLAELRFAGVEKTGEVVLYRKDVQIVSNETTMSRTPVSTTMGNSNSMISASYSGTSNMGTLGANTHENYNSTTIAPASDFHVVVPAEAIAIRLSIGEKRLPMEGYVVEIINASPNSLEYRISKN